MKLITAITSLLALAFTPSAIAHAGTANKQALKYNYEFSICPDVPAMRFTLTWDDQVGDIIINVLEKRTGKLIQQITAEGVEEPYQGPAVFTAEDINYDGCQDLKLLCFTGATGNELYRYWTYNRKTNKFQSEKILEDICNPEIRLSKKEIFSHCKEGGAGAYYIETTYKFTGKKYKLIRQTDQYLELESGRVIREEKEVRNGRMITIKKEEIIKNN
ncbi:MAG: hypothetical protein OEW04_02190 [Nitrospirota bacterium]|nr:hypothetical protein [Nitrospirota bacterium]